MTTEKWKTDLFLVAMIFLAGGLRIYGIQQSLWYDEIFTLLHFVEKPISYIVTHYITANNHILYSILSHVSIRLFGDSELGIRLPALLFGILAVPALYFLARDAFGRRNGALSAFLLVISPYHIYYTQEARGYSGLIFFSILSVLFLGKALQGNRISHWIGFVLTTVLNGYMHLFGIFVMVAQVIFMGLLGWRRRSLSSFRLSRSKILRVSLSIPTSILLIGVLYFPVMGSILGYASTAQADPLSPKFSLYLLVEVFRDFSAGPGYVWSWIPSVLYTVPFLFGLFALGKRRLGWDLLFLSIVIFPLLILGVARQYVTSRFLSFMLPFYLIIVARGIEVLYNYLSEKGKFLLPIGFMQYGMLLAALTVLVELPYLVRYYRTPKQDYRGVAEFLAEQAKPGDWAFSSDIGVDEMKYYVARLRRGPGRIGRVRTHYFLHYSLATYDADRAWYIATSEEGEVEQSILNVVHHYFTKQKTFEALRESDRMELYLHSDIPKRHHLDQAFEEAKKAAGTNPNDPYAYYCLGLLFKGQDKTDEAMTAYRKVLEITRAGEELPSIMMKNIYLGLAALYSQKGQWEEAKEHAERALEIDPESVAAHSALGRIYYSSGSLEEAIRAYETVLKLNPNQIEAYTGLGASYAKKELYSKAIDNYNMYLDHNPDDSEYTREVNGAIAVLASKMVAKFTKEVALEPDSWGGYLELGRGYLALKDYEQTLHSLEKVVELKPDCTEAHRLMADIYNLLRKDKKAIASYRRVIELGEGDGVVYNNLGYLLVDRDLDVSEGCRFIEKAHRFSPDDPNIWDSLGWCYYKQGDYEKALAWLRKTLREMRETDSRYAGVHKHLETVEAVLREKMLE